MKTHLTVEASATVAIHSRALEKKSKGERVYSLSAGEPMVASHPLVIAAAERAMAEGKTHYPPVAGIPELRRAAAALMNTTYGTNYTDKNTLVTCGGKFGIYALCQAFIQPGDETVVLAPYWVSYVGITQLFGGTPKIIETAESNGWKASVSDLEKIVSLRTKILFLNNAANPTGALYTREELNAILSFAQKHKILVISDEVYSGLVYDDGEFVSAGSFPEFQDSVVVVQSCSKHFAMTGWRVGFTFAHPDTIKILSMVQSQSTSGTSSISQWAALAAVENAHEIIPSVRAAMQKRRDLFVKSFNSIFATDITPPASALYAFLPLTTLGVTEADSAKFCMRALEEGNIALVPGAAFGVEGHVRFSFSDTEEEIVAALTALAKFVKE